MITEEKYVDKIRREKERITKSVIDSIRKLIETCAEGEPIIEDYQLTAYQARYFDNKALDKLSKEYPFLNFYTWNNEIYWVLRSEDRE